MNSCKQLPFRQIFALFYLAFIPLFTEAQGLSGCTDSEACNFDPNADLDDGSCAYTVDCAGICGGMSVIDLCGNCFDPNLPENELLIFNFTGSEQAWVVPAGITEIQVNIYGAQGNNGTGAAGGIGGSGAQVSGTLAVSPGETLYLYIGGQNGYNGGGLPGASNAGNGGGASDIRQGGNALINRVAVAGGGGGGGATGCAAAYAGGNGGGGGGLAGSNGINSPNGGAGFGGTLGVGGAAGVGCSCCLGQPGNANGNGGNSYNCCCATLPAGGGGGGGYVTGGGGGGGSAGTPGCSGNDKGGGGGGAGGSNYSNPLSNALAVNAVNLGNGRIEISYNGAPECTLGCTDPLACNFDPEALTDAGNCTYPDGCTNVNACNYDPSATCDNGTCTFPGCNDPAACNYDPAAGCSDESCIYTLDCAGICGGPNELDPCGNCYDPNLPPFQQINFSFTGGQQTWVVPAGLTSIAVEIAGAQGNNGSGASGGIGGLGAFVTGTLSVTPGETLYFFVGGQNGYNGGGLPGASNVGNGGGASDIRQGGNDLINRVAVAGGGGGGGATGCAAAYSGGNGGGGGGLAGSNGVNSPNGGAGFGGSLGIGGAAGIGCSCCLGLPGNANGNGGNSYNCCCATLPAGGGGGGGFITGGGGGGGSAGTPGCSGNDKGGGGGGAGGSNFSEELSNSNETNALQAGNGYITISYGLIPDCFPGCTDPELQTSMPGQIITTEAAYIQVVPIRLQIIMTRLPIWTMVLVLFPDVPIPKPPITIPTQTSTMDLASISARDAPIREHATLVTAPK